jgi:hypothetical protein
VVGDPSSGLRAWLEIASVITTSFPPHVDVCVPRDAAPHPRDAGLRRTLGLGRGRHYSLPLPDGGRLHVRDRGGECYLAHWDVRDPHRDPIGHLILDSPDLTATISGAASAILEFAREGVASLGGLAEALVGGLIFGLLVSNAALHLVLSNVSPST